MRNFTLVALALLSLNACKLPKDYLSSANAPKHGDVVQKTNIEAYLDSLSVPKQKRFYAVLDSIPNRSQFKPVGLLFKANGTFINYRLCNADYRKLTSTINFFDRSKMYYDGYGLQDEVAAIQNFDGSLLSNSNEGHYLLYYWSLSWDNINAKHILDLQEEMAEGENYTVIYINIDNLPEYKMNSEEFLSFLEKNRTIVQKREAATWFDNGTQKLKKTSKGF